MEIPKVAIIGRPNVGKSTLFNRLAGDRKAITSREQGTTRDRVTAEIDWDGRHFLLVDTAGLLVSMVDKSDQGIEFSAHRKAIEILQGLDLILFVVDGRSGITGQDEEITRLLRKFNDKVIVVANKLDNQQMEKKYPADDLGFSDIIMVSAVTGRRCADLLSKVAKRLSIYKKEITGKMPVMTIIGRPNAGKSTLFNKLVGSDIAIVSDIPGTTRDSVRAVFKNGEEKFIIFDTAGYRKRGKIIPGVERFSIYRMLDAIAQSDLALVVIDGEEGITRQDAHLVQLALEQSKDVIVVVNKIDKIKNESTENIDNFYKYKFILKQTIVGISALNKKNINLLVKEIKKRLFA